MKLGILAQRRLYGWGAVACFPLGAIALLTGLASSAAFTSSMVVVSLFLSLLALWQTSRVEAVADPDVTP